MFSFLILCNPVNWRIPVVPVHHYLPKFAQTHVHWVTPLSHVHSTILPFVTLFSFPQSFPVSGSFPMIQLFVLGGQSIGASASTSVLPMNIQGWFPLGLTALISLLSKGLSRVLFSYWLFNLVQYSHSVMSNSLQPHGLQHARLPCPSPSPRVHSNSCPWVGDAIQPSHPLSPSPPTFNLSQHQGLFQWVSSLHQVAKVLELQLKHQSFQWTPKTGIL